MVGKGALAPCPPFNAPLAPQLTVIPRAGGGSSTPEPLGSITNASSYWIARPSTQLRTRRATTDECDSAFSRRDAPEVFITFTLSSNRGRREDRVRAAPAVSCAKCTEENAHEHTGSAEAIRPSLRREENWPKKLS